MRAPMARAVIGGLITSTLLTLLVVPVVYTLLDDFAPGCARRGRAHARRRRAERHVARHGVPGPSRPRPALLPPPPGWPRPAPPAPRPATPVVLTLDEAVRDRRRAEP